MSSGYVYGVPLTPEREKELVEKIASWTVKYSMEWPTILFLQSIKPVGRAISAMGVLYGTVFMGISPAISQYGQEAVALLDNPENIEKIISRIEELSEEKERRRREDQAAERSLIRQPTSIRGRLRRLFLGR
jgi:ribosomal protein S15P/S13E